MAITFSTESKPFRRRTTTKRVSFRDLKSNGQQPIADVFWVENRKRSDIPVTASLEGICCIF